MFEIHHNCLFANPADFVESDSSTCLLRHVGCVRIEGQDG